MVINRGMFNEHISKHHSRINLNIDIDRLGKAYFDFKHHLGFKNDDKRKERAIAYLELSLESIKRKIDKIK